MADYVTNRTEIVFKQQTSNKEIENFIKKILTPETYKWNNKEYTTYHLNLKEYVKSDDYNYIDIQNYDYFSKMKKLVIDYETKWEPINNHLEKLYNKEKGIIKIITNDYEFDVNGEKGYFHIDEKSVDEHLIMEL